jgi:formamidopyrimidine-DNA glycosylase
VQTRQVTGTRRLGKRVVIVLEDALFLVIHLMIAGRLRWEKPRCKIPGKLGLAAFDFPNGSLLLTEAGSHKRASLHVVRGEDDLRRHDPGGLEPLTASLEDFRAALRAENHTLKRALTDPQFFSGIGNAYSDEILHAARLSPLQQTFRLTLEELERLFRSTQEVLRDWTARLIHDYEDRFPGAGDVTAFRPEFAVHGKFEKPCPDCGTPVQRIRYADNETNYCPLCQTGGRILNDRSLARLLKADWPKTVQEMEVEGKPMAEERNRR